MKKFFGVVLLMFVGASYADTETVSWYKDGTVYDTTTCQTGDDITVPTAPTKRGYTFNGWVFAYDFSTLDPDVNGTSYTYSASNRTWTTVFSYGIVSGKSLCSVTPGTYAVAGTPDETTTGETQYCWCRATGYTPSGSNIVYENTSSSSWVFNRAYGSASDCASDCAINCGGNVQNVSAFRRAVFGVTQ